MKDIIKSTITAKDAEITVLTTLNNDDYISLTDIAKYKDSENPRYIIQNWMRNKTTVEFLGLWEQLNNPQFKLVDFDHIRPFSPLDENDVIMLLFYYINHNKGSDYCFFMNIYFCFIS